MVAARYASCVRYVRKATRRPALRRSTAGSRRRRGELIAFLSADDMWAPAKTSRQVAYLSEHPPCRASYTVTWRSSTTHGRVVHPSFLEAFRRARPSRARSFRCCCSETSSPAARDGAGEPGRPVLPDRRPGRRVGGLVDGVSRGTGAEIGLIREPLYRYRRHGDNMNLGSSGRSAAADRARRAAVSAVHAHLARGGSGHPRRAARRVQRLRPARPPRVADARRADQSVLPVDDDDRAAAQARIASSQQHAAGGHTSLAACDLVAALAHNPWDGDAATRIHAAQRRGRVISPLALIGEPPEMRGFEGPGIAPEIAPDARIEAFVTRRCRRGARPPASAPARG